MQDVGHVALAGACFPPDKPSTSLWHRMPGLCSCILNLVCWIRKGTPRCIVGFWQESATSQHELRPIIADLHSTYFCTNLIWHFSNYYVRQWGDTSIAIRFPYPFASPSDQNEISYNSDVSAIYPRNSLALYFAVGMPLLDVRYLNQQLYINIKSGFSLPAFSQ